MPRSRARVSAKRQRLPPPDPIRATSKRRSRPPRILRRQGDKSGALALLDQAASAAPNDARLFRDRGLLALELGAVARARDHLQHAVASGSRDWLTYSALGTALAASGKQKDAQRQFAEALKQAPDNPVVLNNLALSLALDGRRGEAEQMLRRASAGKEKASDARVAQNLALLGQLGGRAAKAAEKPVEQRTSPARFHRACRGREESRRAVTRPHGEGGVGISAADAYGFASSLPAGRQRLRLLAPRSCLRRLSRLSPCGRSVATEAPHREATCDANACARCGPRQRKLAQAAH